METTSAKCDEIASVFIGGEGQTNAEQIVSHRPPMPTEHFWLDSRYHVVRSLGEGAFGAVFLVIDDFIGQFRALKIPKNNVAQNIMTTEISVMQQLARGASIEDKPLLQLFDYRDNQGVLANIHNEVISDSVSYIITQYAEFGDLATHIIQNNQEYRNGQSEQKIFTIFEQLLDGVETIHQKGFVHLDLKPDNILVWSEQSVAISDFALSKPIKGEDGKGNFIKYRAGSKNYWSPEMYSGFSYNGEQSDLYALGVILFILTFGVCPFQQASTNDVYFQQLVKSPVEYWRWHPETSRRIAENSVSPDLIKLINLMLCPYPQYRLSIDKIKKHSWYITNKISERVQWFGQNFRNSTSIFISYEDNSNSSIIYHYDSNEEEDSSDIS